MPEHSHCKFCGDPIPFGEEYCDDECRKNEVAREAAETRKDMMFYVSSGVAIIVIVVAGLIIY